MSNLVLQHITRVSMLGMDLDARTDLADEPCIEAETLGVLLEYKRPRVCRELVRRLVDDGRLSCTAPHGTAPQNSADNSGLSSAEHRAVDVYPVEVIEPHGVRLGTTEQLWLTERACLLVATASETDRAWQVRTALVDFFLACRRERTNASTPSVHVPEPFRTLVVMVAGIDARLHDLEVRSGMMGVPLLDDVIEDKRKPITPPVRDVKVLIDDLEAALAAAKAETISAREALWVYPQIARFGRNAAALSNVFRLFKGVDIDGRTIVCAKEGSSVRWWVRRRDDHDSSIESASSPSSP